MDQPNTPADFEDMARGVEKHRAPAQAAMIFAGVDVAAAIIIVLLWTRYPSTWLIAVSIIIIAAPLVPAAVVAITTPRGQMRNLTLYIYLIALVLSAGILYIPLSAFTTTP